MTGYSRSPRVLKGGIVLMDAGSGAIRRVVALQYNPDTLTRSLKARGAAENSDRVEALRLSGPPVETINVEAVLDATDRLEKGDSRGIAADLAALETILYPPSSSLIAQNTLSSRGAIEILPAMTPLVLFTWGPKRILPVRITDFSVTEEAFDTELNPIRAKVTLGMRILSVNDLAFGSRGAGLSLANHRLKEALAVSGLTGGTAALGTGSLV